MKSVFAGYAGLGFSEFPVADAVDFAKLLQRPNKIGKPFAQEHQLANARSEAPVINPATAGIFCCEMAGRLQYLAAREHDQTCGTGMNATWSLTVLPSVAFPVGLCSDRLPLSIQFASAHQHDGQLLSVPEVCDLLRRVPCSTIPNG